MDEQEVTGSNSSGSGSGSSTHLDEILTCLQLLHAHSIHVVVFDMDQTAVATHSRGRLQRASLDTFLNQITPDFQRLVPHLHENGFHLAIATHSDEAEFKKGRQAALIDPTTHILGKELVMSVLHHCFEDKVANSFFIVAHNPRAHDQMKDPLNCIKRYHMREILNHFSVGPKEILFFDDDRQVVMDCADHCGVRAIHVNKTKGFHLDDLTRGLSSSEARLPEPAVAGCIVL